MGQSVNAADLLLPHADTLVEGFEGDILKSYQDGNKIWTIGYGHTGSDIGPGMVITQEQANEYLRQDLVAAEQNVLDYVKVPLNQNQFDALTSFDFNIGVGHLAGSTTLRLLNAGDYAGAASAMLMWNKIGGAPSAGLTRRRQAERDLFLKPMEV